MNDFDIKAFLTIVDKGTFTNAADELSMTQPALSQRIRLLEEELGFSLFVRQKGHRQTELTQKGRLFLHYATQINSLWQCSLELGREKKRQQLRISVVESVMHYSMPQIFRTFMEQFPEIHIILTSYYSQEAYQLIQQGKLDVAIVGRLIINPDYHVSIIPLYSDPWVFACAADSDYPDPMPLSRLIPEEQLLMFTNEKAEWLDLRLPDPSYSKFTGDTASFYNASMFTGQTWAIIPASIGAALTRQGFCRTCRLETSPPDRIIYAVTNGDSTSDSINKLLDCIRSDLHNNPYIHVMI